jgi:hypothetical protein
MARKIAEVDGIGPAYAQMLHAAGVKTDADMLGRTASPTESQVADWISQA